MSLSVKFANSYEDVVRIAKFRLSVWHAEGIKPFGPYVREDGLWIEPLDLSDDTVHVFVESDGDIVGSARISFHKSIEDVPERDYYAAFADQLQGRIASINRLAVRKDFRGKGLAKILVRKRLEVAFEHGFDRLVVWSLGDKIAAKSAVFGYRILDVAKPPHGLPVEGKRVYVMTADYDTLAKRFYGSNDAAAAPASQEANGTDGRV